METNNEEHAPAVHTVWNKVTPFSKYAAMALFIAMPFIGGWVGYTYVPVTGVGQGDFSTTNEDIPPVNSSLFVSTDSSRENGVLYRVGPQDEFFCRHKIADIPKSEYEKWPRYVDAENRFSFAYPPDMKANQTEENLQPGVSLSLAYHKPQEGKDGIPSLPRINDQWRVSVTNASSTLPRPEACTDGEYSLWCLVEQVKLPGVAATATVVSVQSKGMLYPHERIYYVPLSNNGELQLSTQTSLWADTPVDDEHKNACSFIGDVFTIDFIAHSLIVE